MPCLETGCLRPKRTRGRCSAHYEAYRISSDFQRIPPLRCEVVGCTAPHHGLGYCQKHYQAMKLRGVPVWDPPTEVERFWLRIDRSGGPDSCWTWTGALDSAGYGQLMFGGRRSQKSHRVSWELHNGPIPTGLWVLHRCDNPPCVNPAHLFLGTLRDNVADMVAKGRQAHPIGTRHPMARLTEDQVAVIKRRLLDGEHPDGVAADFPISSGMVRRIRDGLNWRHVEAVVS